MLKLSVPTKGIFSLLFCATLLPACVDEPDDLEPSGDPADFTVVWETVIGTSEGEDFSGMAMDASGNLFVTLAEEPDGYQGDIVVMKVNNDGSSVTWAKKFDLGDQDNYPSSSENGHANGGGGSRCMEIDASGDLYITGQTKNGFYDVFVTKISGSTGNIIWQKFWEADNSGLAKGEAKAYAMTLAGGYVFVTGGSAGGTSGSGGAQVFLLKLDAATGAIQTETKRGIDPTPGSNDRGNTIFSPDGNTVYIAGWEGENNEGLLMKFTNGGADFAWMEEIEISYGSRFIDMTCDANENLYLAADFRGVSTFVGVLSLDSSGAYRWGKKYQGASNDRNNIHSIRLINDVLYVGGRVSYSGFDESQFGDGLLLKMSTSGDLLKEYHYYTSYNNHTCGERIEGILSDGTSIYLGGETWPQSGEGIEGGWYKNTGNFSNYNPSIAKLTSCTIDDGDGSEASSTWTVSSFTPTVRNTSDGSIGSADVILWKITE